MSTYAYCYRSGLIGFGHDVPKGALIICACNRQRRRYIVARARHSRTSDDMLVPGIPDATSDDEALDALVAFRDWIVFDVAPGKGWKPVRKMEARA